ncbi:hypothetical protein N9512_00625 [Amylibacter sp.]|nr:hypothetical protein [Amylibacter sp.]
MSFVCVKNNHLKNANIHTCEVANQCSNIWSETTTLNRQATREPIRGNNRGTSAITKRTAILRQLLKLALGAKEIDIYTRYEPDALPLMPNIYKLPDSRMLSNGMLTEYELRFLRYTMYASVVK